MTKSATQKRYQQQINSVWQYIQRNLDKRLSLDVLAEVACISPYHFHRIFTAYTGESVNQYTKRLRLERAANQLLQSKRKTISDIAIESGYDSLTAFSKAFRQHYKISPSVYRQHRREALVPYRFDSVSAKENNMQHKIIGRPETRVLYIRRLGDYMQSAPKAWDAMDAYAEQHQLISDKTEMIGICHDSPEITDKDKIRYDACIPVANNVSPDGEFNIQLLRGGDYAVFLHEGPYETLTETYDRISNEWIANQDRELADAPVFEIYLNPELAESNPQGLKTEIYFPLN